jgi:hypothetical protein
VAVPKLAKGALLALIVAARAAEAGEIPKAAPPKAPAPPAETPRNTDAEAKRLFLRGLELADRGVWAEALEAFRGSLALAVRPSTVFNVGNALYRLGRTREAIESFRRYLALSDPKADRKMRERTEELLKVSLAALVSFELTLSPEDAVVKVNGAPEPGSGKSRLIVLDAGKHRVEVAAEGWVSASFDVSAGAGEKIAQTVALVREIREGTLVVTTSVDDAMIKVDAKSEGIGQVELKLAPGRHVVEVEAKGHAPSKQDVTITRGARSELRVTLVALPPPPSAEDPGLLSRPVFWIVAGAVVAAAGAAAVLVATRSEDPAYSGTLGRTF